MPSILSTLRIILRTVPVLVSTLITHTLSLTPTSKIWTLRTELTIAIIRIFLNDPKPPTITAQQQRFLDDPPVKGPVWISKVTLPAPPEDDIRQALDGAIRGLKGELDAGMEYTLPPLLPVGGEWTGPRSGINISENTPEPSHLSEAEKYTNMTDELHAYHSEQNTKPPTILYFHGGSLYLMDPSTTRPASTKYARTLHSRVLSVRYRLAPQHPFPSALLDALLAYLSLLHPPPTALHAPVPASQIIIAGDSAGGNIALALLLTLLQINRNPPKSLTFHNKPLPLPLPLPAALSLLSPSCDLTRCLPSVVKNAVYDYLPPRIYPTPPPCAVWPARPPRAHLYCEGSALCHPLVSPVAARAEMWVGAPWVFLQVGEEMLADEGGVVARRMKEGVMMGGGSGSGNGNGGVVWEQYGGMPHCFGLLLGGEQPEVGMGWEGVKGFCEAVVNGGEVVGGGVFVSKGGSGLERREVDVGGVVSGLEDEEVERLMESARRGVVERAELGM
ncbi:hypothetical protein FQN55_003489 [Onygenales sp. PD_40]|nr:hypothetical protein FQN55_003489 [Onygenales sp. PD_40]